VTLAQEPDTCSSAWRLLKSLALAQNSLTLAQNSLTLAQNSLTHALNA